jgi:hypothetical protein
MTSFKRYQIIKNKEVIFESENIDDIRFKLIEPEIEANWDNMIVKNTAIGCYEYAWRIGRNIEEALNKIEGKLR